LYLYLAGYYYRKKGDLDTSISTFQKVYDFSSQIKQLQIASLYESGWSFYLLQNWEKAIEYFQHFLRGRKRKRIKLIKKKIKHQVFEHFAGISWDVVLILWEILKKRWKYLKKFLIGLEK
jgi:tetratricopeptide (TPR) repeat protein